MSALYEVISGTMWSVDVVCDDGTGPMEPEICYCQIEASSKREAIRAAIKTPEFRDWVKYQRGDGCNPFTGVKAAKL
jgi:hypothetical protein